MKALRNLSFMVVVLNLFPTLSNAEESNELFSESFIELLCSITESGEHETLVTELRQEGHSLASAWAKIDCLAVDFPGPSLLHLAIQTRNSKLTKNLAITLSKLKSEPAIDQVVSSLNSGTPYNGRARTVLDIIAIASEGSVGSTIKNEYASAVESLREIGAKTSEELSASAENNATSSKELSMSFVRFICILAYQGEYTEIVERLQSQGHNLISAWNKIDCTEANYPGPSLLHLAILDRDPTLTRDLSVGLVYLHRQGVENDMASQLNQLVRYNGRGRTILDGIRIARMGTSSVTSKNEYSSAEKALRELGAKTSEELDAANE